MSVPSSELETELERVWSALRQDLGLPTVAFQLQGGALHAFLQGDLLVVPKAYADHFARFGNVPTRLVRDLAYEAKKRQLSLAGESGSSLEADAMVYAEVFLRAVLMQDED